MAARTRSRTVPQKWLRGPNDALAVQRGCYFDPAAGEKVCEFIEGFCRQSKDPWAGQLVKLLPWQRDFLMRLYSWKRADGTRRYRKAYLEVAKKNGKSTLISALSLYHLIADGEQGAEVNVCAFDRAQASIVFDEALHMVEASPELNGALKCVPSAKAIVHEQYRGVLKANSAETKNKDGKNSSCVIFDELHTQRGRDMWRAFRGSGATRRQPLTISISTAGVDRESICYEEYQYSLKVNDGRIQNVDHLGVIHEASKDDDIDDPETWRKANPSLGVTISEEDFAADLQEAKDRPADLNDFLRRRLNIWTNAHGRYFSREAWEACGERSIDHELLRTCPCWAGLDMSSTQDLTAFCLLFLLPDGHYAATWRFWVPEEGAEQREKRDQVPYTTWAREGYLALCSGAVVDYDEVQEAILECADIYDLRMTFVDPFNAQQLITNLDKAGLRIKAMRQGILSMNGPVKELERRILTHTLHHGNHPVASWCADNSEAETDHAGNVRLSKSKSREKIDGMIALVEAVAASMETPTEDGPSVYESRGLLYI